MNNTQATQWVLRLVQCYARWMLRILDHLTKQRRKKKKEKKKKKKKKNCHVSVTLHHSNTALKVYAIATDLRHVYSQLPIFEYGLHIVLHYNRNKRMHL